MQYIELIPAAILFFSVWALFYKKTFSALFACSYLFAWAAMKILLENLGLYEAFVPPVFSGCMIDLFFIGMIALMDLRTRYVLTALLLSNLYGSVCMLEDYLGGYRFIELYGPVNMLLGAAVAIGGFYNDPRGAGVLGSDGMFANFGSVSLLGDKVPSEEA